MRHGRASFTAKLVAYWRSLGDLGVTSVPNFSDPFARRLLDGRFWQLLLRRGDTVAADAHGKAALRMRPWIDSIILRVTFIDAAIARSDARQVVILGAGLDTRAWRLEALRGARVFEVDHPATHAYKRERVARLGPPLADVEYVSIDFTRDDLSSALESAGHDRALPTAWAWEGVIMYLDDRALRSTLHAIRKSSAPGSTLIAHYHEPEPGASAKTLRRLVFSWIGEPQIGLRTRESIRDELTRAEFSLVEDAGLAEQAARVGASAQTATDARLEVSRVAIARPVG